MDSDRSARVKKSVENDETGSSSRTDDGKSSDWKVRKVEKSEASASRGSAPSTMRPDSSLSGVARAGALSVLEECSDALAVYQRTLKNLQRQQQQQQRGLTNARLPFDSRHLTVPSETSLKYYNRKDSESAFEMGNQEIIFEKLRQDCQWLELLVYSTKRSLQIDGNLNVLIEEVASKMATRTDEEELLKKALKAEEKLNKVRREVTEEREKRRREEERLRNELLRLRNEKERLSVKSLAESAYVKAWLDSRREQHQLRAELARRELTNGLRECQVREENERLVTDKVEAFLRQSIEENEKGARDWSERRQTETKYYEKEIHRLQGEIDEKRKALDELEKEYKSRQDFIDICLAEKEAIRLELELEEHRRCSAIKIQAWWRGVMVRRKLGPYRSEEKKRKRPAKPKK